MSEMIGETSKNTYLGKPLRVFEGTYRIKANKKEYLVPVQFAIHPNHSGRIIINVPGYNGVIDGYGQKYKILAHHIQSQELAAVVRTGNHLGEGYPPDINLNAALEYAKQHAWEICGEPEPEILLMGFSAGASAIAARAHEHPQVARILLFAPSTNMPISLIKDGLEKFKGDVYIVVGEDDDVVGPETGQYFYDLATGASSRKLFVIADCDHQFRGEKNGRIISQAPFYAFREGAKSLFPDPRGGIKLYD